MYEFKITVEISGLPEAINRLADALSAGHSNIVCNQNGANCQHIDNAGTVNIDHTPAKFPTPETPTTAGASTAPTLSATPTDAAVTAPAATSPYEGKSYTLDDLSNAGTALIDQGKMTQLCDLLAKYGVQAVTQLSAESYPAFVADLKALGAQL